MLPPSPMLTCQALPPSSMLTCQMLAPSSMLADVVMMGLEEDVDKERQKDRRTERKPNRSGKTKE